MPLPCLNDRDFSTNCNVIFMNGLIFNECKFRKFYYLDVFDHFVFPVWQRWNPHIRDDSLFELRGIHPSPDKGMGILAKIYLRALHSKYFDPYTFQ